MWIWYRDVGGGGAEGGARVGVEETKERGAMGSGEEGSVGEEAPGGARKEEVDRPESSPVRWGIRSSGIDSVLW